MIVADSTTVVGLSLIRSAGLIGKLLGIVTISEATMREVKGTLAALDPDCPLPGEDVVKVAPIDVTGGALSTSESETIELGRQTEAVVLLSDDPVVRAEAQTYGMSSIGTIGVLYAAHARKLVPDVEEPLRKLREAGWAVSPSCEEVLRKRAKA